VKGSRLRQKSAILKSQLFAWTDHIDFLENLPIYDVMIRLVRNFSSLLFRVCPIAGS
jgi:hypothetical protein